MAITPLHAWISNRIGCEPGNFSPTALADYQLTLLNQTLVYASEHCPFYREKLSGFLKGLPDLDGLKIIPFTTPEDLRQDPVRFVCVSQDEVERIITLPTSGTSGQPKRIYFSIEDQELTVDFFQIGMSTLAKPGDRVLILLPGPKPGTVGQLLTVGLERLGCIPILYGLVDDEERVLQLIQKESVDVLVGVPAQLLRLLRADEDRCIVGKGMIRSILTSTDILSPVIRKTLEGGWGCEVFDHYGMTETGLGGGVECDCHSGFHMRAADLLYEIIDPITGLSVPDGDPGEIVFSTLTRRAMPLIRYRTGDAGRILSGICGCGSFIHRVTGITHRIGSEIELSCGKLYQSDLDQALFGIKGLMDFSSTLDTNKTPSILQLSVWIQSGRKEIIQAKLEEALDRIPVIHQAQLSGLFRLEIRELEKPQNSRVGYLSKRSISRL